jgi:ADP-ribose pyrophosphatase YjhB (NUDIX family)
MSSQAMAIEAAPSAVCNFYGNEPTVSPGKFTKYSCEGSSVSFMDDSFGGRHVQFNSCDPACYEGVQEKVETFLKECINEQAKDSVWFTTPYDMSARLRGNLIPEGIRTQGESVLNSTGEVIHYASGTIIDMPKKTMHQWVWVDTNKEPTIPEGAQINMGATALLVNEASQQVLLVRNVRRSSDWNLPGGCANKLEMMVVASWRELNEEAGNSVDYYKREDIERTELVGLKEFSGNPYAPAINPTIAFFGSKWVTDVNPPKSEICEARWFDIKTVSACDGKLEGFNVNEEILSAVRAVEKGTGYLLLQDKGGMQVWGAK